MARQIKEHKNLNCKVEKEVFEILNSFVEKTGMSKTATVERALREYIERYNKTGKI